MKSPGTERRPRILSVDPLLRPYAPAIRQRMEHYQKTRDALLGKEGDISSFANGYLYYGIHRTQNGWVIREHAPGADGICLTGEFNGWNRHSHPLHPIGRGDWELLLDGADALRPGERVLLCVSSGGKTFDRIPAYAASAVQDQDSRQFCARVVEENSYVWHDQKRARTMPSPLLIYECHIGMAQEKEGIGSYDEFAEKVLPRIKADGYNAIQLMAIQEHPYYASFGYQVTNLFAPSSWYGQPDGLKRVIDQAHQMGLRVLLDLVHSHASDNERDGVANFDGSGSLYCQGRHPAWGSRLYCYGRHDVLHFLLSNIKFWLEEYHFDGFRFDGVTSMLYRDHALGKCFTSYEDYYTENADLDAAAYLMLATELIHAVRPGAVAVAEDMSGMPGMCLPIAWGGFGFDYRLNMGVPDLWIKLIKEYRDEDWDMFLLWHELTTRRPREKTIGYAESHDQALVGDKTILFRLLDAEMYTGMDRAYHSFSMDRGIALSKLIRFITLTVACDGYLNFMGNEFGHPEWIDFPREGNGWSFRYARRQWHLADDGFLKYQLLGNFDRDMLRLVKKNRVLADRAARSLWIDQKKKVLAFERGGLVFVFCFGGEPLSDEPAQWLPEGTWRAVWDSDRPEYGGTGRVSADLVCVSGSDAIISLPERTALVLERESSEKND